MTQSNLFFIFSILCVILYTFGNPAFKILLWYYSTEYGELYLQRLEDINLTFLENRVISRLNQELGAEEIEIEVPELTGLPETKSSKSLPTFEEAVKSVNSIETLPKYTDVA